MNNFFYIKTTYSYILIIFLHIGYFQSNAQGPNFGNIYIASGGGMSFHNTSQNFHVGQNGALGIIGTERVTTKGYLSFVGNSSYVGAIDNAHVDGYVKTYMTIPFTFPIGDNNKYRPAAISNSSLSNPTDAAYYGVDASTANTSSLKGGTEPVLPTGGPFNTLSIANDVKVVDNVEYWDINGTTSTKIILTWDIRSNIGEITSNNLNTLTILGWDGTKWVRIPSTFDTTSLLGGSSTVSNGSITTDINIIPNAYTIYTLGVVASPDLTIAIGQPLPSPIVAQPSFIPVTVTNIGSAPTTGSQTVVLKIPTGTGFGTFPVNNNGWTCSTSGITATCVNPTSIANGANSIFNVPFIATASQAGTPLTIPSAVVSGGGEPLANTGNNTSNTITTPNVGGANLTPNFTFSSTSFAVGAIKSLVVNINEIGNISTNGTAVEVFIPYSSGFTYAFSSSQTSVTVVGIEVVNNPDWTLTVKPAGLLLSSTTIIPANGRSRIGLAVTADRAGTVANITANITPNGGGETNPYNNEATLAQSVQK